MAPDPTCDSILVIPDEPPTMTIYFEAHVTVDEAADYCDRAGYSSVTIVRSPGQRTIVTSREDIEHRPSEKRSPPPIHLQPKIPEDESPLKVPESLLISTKIGYGLKNLESISESGRTDRHDEMASLLHSLYQDDPEHSVVLLSAYDETHEDGALLTLLLTKKVIEGEDPDSSLDEITRLVDLFTKLPTKDRG